MDTPESSDEVIVSRQLLYPNHEVCGQEYETAFTLTTTEVDRLRKAGPDQPKGSDLP